jgi:hypothetical protein
MPLPTPRTVVLTLDGWTSGRIAQAFGVREIEVKRRRHDENATITIPRQSTYANLKVCKWNRVRFQHGMTRESLVNELWQTVLPRLGGAAALESSTREVRAFQRAVR